MPATSKKLSKNELKSIKELIEIISSNVKRLQFSVSAQDTNVRIMRDLQSVMNEKLDEHTGKLDALLVDVHQLQEESKANTDEFQDLHALQRDMKQVKENLGLDAS